MKIAVVGATGLVGQEMLKVLAERDFQASSLYPVASQRSLGKKIDYVGQELEVISVEQALEIDLDFALFSAGGDFSLAYAPLFLEKGITVIDNSSVWRMDKDVKLIVPEINGHLLNGQDRLIANPNCSTIQLVMALWPLHERYKLKRVVVSTYQSITGTGKKAVDQMNAERRGDEAEMVYPHKIDQNCLPHCDDFLENNYTKEEMKLVNESRKIMAIEDLRLTATAVRVPVLGGHSESVNVSFENQAAIEEIKLILSSSPGICLIDDPSTNSYPMPLTAKGKNDVFVGRIRRDYSEENGINMWIVSDNLRKGAATNTVQIAEYLIRERAL